MSRLNDLLKVESGFLLLEVLISVVIISVSLAYVAHAFSSSSRAIETSARFLKSVSLIESKMWDFEAEGSVKKGVTEGGFEEDALYRWEADADAAKDIPLNSLKLKVEWRGPVRRQSVSVVTYLYNDEE